MAVVILISVPYALSRLGKAEADYSLAPVSVDITITVTPVLIGTALAAANFRAIYVTDNVVLLQWDGLPTGATSVMIRVRDNAYSDNYSDGYFLYDGTGDNVTDTNVNFNEYFGYKNYTAYSYNGTDWSPFYSQARVVSPNVAEIANQLTIFNTLFGALNGVLTSSLGSILCFLLVLVITILAFWQGQKGNNFLYLLAAPVDLVYGLTYAATQTVASASWVSGLIVAIIGTYCLINVSVAEVRRAVKRRKKV